MSSLKGLKFIFSYMKQYKISLTVVVIFILLTTYFNVVTPKLLGDSIDNLITYVTGEVEVNIGESIEAGEGFPEETREDIQAAIDENPGSDLQNLLDMSNEDLQTMYEFNKELVRILKLDVVDSTIQVSVDGESISDLSTTTAAIAGTFTDKQITEIQNSTVFTDQEKMGLLTAPTEQIQKVVENVYYNDDFTRESVDASRDTFIHGLIVLVVAYILLSLSNYLYMTTMVKTSARTTRDMRNSMFQKIEDLSIRFFDTTPDGDLLSRFVNDIDNISNALNQSFTQAASQIVMLIAIIFMMFREDETVFTYTMASGSDIIINNFLAWIMLAFGVLAIVMSIIFVKNAQKHISIQQGKLGDLNTYIDEKLQGQKAIVAYGLEDDVLKGLEPYNNSFKETSTKGQIYSGLLMPTITGLGYVNLALLVFLGSIFIANGSETLTIGTLIVFINYSQRFFQPLAQFFSQYNLIELALTGANRVKEIMNEESEIVNSPNAVEIDGIEGKVEMKDVNFSYQKGKKILNDINIDVKKGQMVALVGPTGSGKTTVMNLINRFYDIDSGTIAFDGRDIKDISLDSLRRNVGIVLQESVIFKGTIRENIAYGKDDATEEEIISAATQANLHDYIMHLDDGYDTMVTNGSSIFSTGQKQLLSIARTIITDPDLLILDEATSNVDTVTEAKIQIAINNILKNRTSFVIAHRLKTILNADIIVVLRDGNIIEKGSHEELMQENGFYAELYNNQFVE